MLVRPKTVEKIVEKEVEVEKIVETPIVEEKIVYQKVEVPKELSPNKEPKKKTEVKSKSDIKKDIKPQSKPEKKPQNQTKEKAKKTVNINGSIRVNDLARKLGKRGNEVVKKLVELGEMASLNDDVDQETAVLVSEEFGFEVKFEEEQKLTEEITDYPIIDNTYSDENNTKNRHPVVTVMGHVDHGKTSVSYTHLRAHET